MEMEYKDPSKRGKFIVLMGVVLALAAGGAAFYLINQAQQQAGQGPIQKVSVVVAARPIAARKPVEADDVIVREIPIDATNSAAIAITQPDQVIGHVLAVSVFQDQMLTVNMLASTSTGGQFSILEPGETVAPDSEVWRAVSITVADNLAVGGMIQPGMTVDIIATATVNVPQNVIDRGKYYTDKSTKVMYQNMVILAKGAGFYVLKATLPVAEEITHLQAAGNATFAMLLRPEADTRMIDATRLGETTNRIIAKYGLPVPEVYPPGNGPLPTPLPTAAITPAPTVAPSGSPAPSATP
jgi:Flp pilus assembly protein CpaB